VISTVSVPDRQLLCSLFDDAYLLLPLSQKKVPRPPKKTKIRSIFVEKNSNAYE
jgi:hypothetical protein